MSFVSQFTLSINFLFSPQHETHLRLIHSAHSLKSQTTDQPTLILVSIDGGRLDYLEIFARP